MTQTDTRADTRAILARFSATSDLAGLLERAGPSVLPSEAGIYAELIHEGNHPRVVGLLCDAIMTCQFLARELAYERAHSASLLEAMMVAARGVETEEEQS